MSATGGPVDLAIIAVPAEQVPKVARECGEAGVAGLVVITAGFSEAGPDGAARQAELLEACRASGMRLIGPNCLGVVNTDPDVALSATFARADVPAGSVGFVSQSGAFGAAAIDGAVRRGIGLSAFVSLGDKTDLSSNDFLQYWEQDPATEVVALYLESFGNPRKFGRVARRVARAKPVLAVKAGRTSAGARAASSHTGALIAASDEAVEALFASAGVIRCDGLDDLLDAAAVLAEQPLPESAGVAIVANARGPLVVCADACADAGLDVVSLTPQTQAELKRHLSPESVVAGPVQLPVYETPERFRAAVEAVAADPGVHAVIAVFVEYMPTGAEQAGAALSAVEASVRCWPCSTPGPLPDILRRGARSPRSAGPSGRRWRSAARRPTPAGGARRRRCPSRWRTWTRTRRRACWPRRSRGAAAGGRGGARRPARRLRDPAGGAAPGRLAGRRGQGRGRARWGRRTQGHRRRCRPQGAGRRRAARTERSDRRAPRAQQIGERLLAAGTPVEGFLVQRMVGPGVEMLVGVLADERFGPVVACGAGGGTAEVLGDVGVRLAPLAREDALEMIGGLRSRRLLAREGADVDALADIAVRVGALADGHPAIAELDLNPVMVGARGAAVVDARVRVAPPPSRPLFPALTAA